MENMTRKRLVEFLILCLMVVSSKCAFAQTSAKQTPESIAEQSTRQSSAASEATPASLTEAQVRVGAGDLLEIKVFDVPELAQAVRVNDLGDASFNLIGRLHVGDLTPDEAREAIAKKLVEGHFLVNPQVSVLILEYGTQGVSILGEVQRPGVYSILGNRTLLDVMSQAGGTTMYAGTSVTIKRVSDGTLLTISLTKNAKNTLASDVHLQPGDKIFIPRASLVYVLGDVGRPGGYLMQNGGRMSVLQAVALAGGHTRTASIGQIRLIHKTDPGYTDSQIPLKKIMNGQKPDMELQAEDILYVPNSSAKSLIFRTAPGIIQSASAAAIYSTVF